MLRGNCKTSAYNHLGKPETSLVSGVLLSVVRGMAIFLYYVLWVNVPLSLFSLSLFCFPLQFYFMNLGPFHVVRTFPSHPSPFSLLLCIFVIDLCVWFICRFVCLHDYWCLQMLVCLFFKTRLQTSQVYGSHTLPSCDYYFILIFKYLRHALCLCWFTTSLCLNLDFAVFITQGNLDIAGKIRIDKIKHVSINVNYICAAENYHQYIISVICIQVKPRWV